MQATGARAGIAIAGVALGLASALGPALAQSMTNATGWTGVYVGGAIGPGAASFERIWSPYTADFGLGPTYIVNSPEITSGGFNGYGVSKSVQVGYDYHLGSGALAGVLASFDWLGFGFSSAVSSSIVTPSKFELHARTSWALGARLGYLPSPEALWFISGGLTEVDVLRADSKISQSKSANGFFLGAGAEVRLGAGFFLTSEYRVGLHERVRVLEPFQHRFGGSESAEATTHQMRFGLSYKLALGQPDSAPVPSAAPLPMGVYAGLSAGAGLYGITDSYASKWVSSTDEGRGGQGGLAGGVIGYDFRLTPMFSVGAFADVEWRDWAYQSKIGIDNGLQQKAGAAAVVGARLGYIAGPSTLLFASLGIAWADHGQLTFAGHPVGFRDGWYSGHFVGGGLETMLTSAISLRGEYRFARYERHTDQQALGTDTREPWAQSARLSLVYRTGLLGN